MHICRHRFWPRHRRYGAASRQGPGTSAQLWMNLQNRYDVEVDKREIGKKLDKIEPIIAHAAA